MRTAYALPALLLAAAGCVGGIGDPNGFEGPNPSDPTAAAIEPAAAVLPRLTESQYRNALADLFGPALPELSVEPDTSPYLFVSIGASTTSLSELGTQQYEENADAISHYVFADPARRAVFAGCEVTAPGDACVRSTLASFGRRAFRRSLTAAELDGWVAAATEGSTPDGWEGLRLAIAGMLQAPSFLYRIELGEPDPQHPGYRRLTDLELAGRLAFVLWDSLPDEALLDAAESGALATEDGVRDEVERMLESPRARHGLHVFFDQYLDLDRLDGLARDPATYPLFTPGLPAAMQREVELIVDDLVFERRADVRTLFSTQSTFVNSELAALYGVDAPGADATTFVPVTLPASGPRAGLLTLGAFLAMNAHETQTSPTARGKYIRERVLCEEVQPPPPNVPTDITPQPGDAPMTMRQKMEEHRKNPQCAGCHAFIDPPGMLFEHFDSLGSFRELETPIGGGDPLPIDSSGDLDGKPLADGKALAALLANEPKVGRCMVRQLFRHAAARLEVEGEEPLLEDLYARFDEGGFDFQRLVVELFAHEGFRRVKESDVTETQP